MLISCSSCNSKYLVNSADLKPNGRTVQCAKCGHNWFQLKSTEEEGFSSTSIPPSNKIADNDNNNQIANLPSTYIKKQEPSIMNSILVVTTLTIIIIVFWLLNNSGMNFSILIIFYLQEFYFNLKMIINDLAKIIHQILN